MGSIGKVKYLDFLVDGVANCNRKLSLALAERCIVEDGTHHKLSQAGGVYETLWDRQSGAFLESED